MKISPEYMLDKTLEWFAMEPDDMGIGEQMVARLSIQKDHAYKLIVAKFRELDSNEFYLYYGLILDKLKKDGYLSGDSNYSSITFEGKLFCKKGGYACKSKKETTQTNLQSWQTWAIVIGTLGAGIYGLIEVLKLFCKST